MDEQVTADRLPADNMPKDGSELMKVFLPASPFVQEPGVSLVEIEDGRAVRSCPSGRSWPRSATWSMARRSPV